MAVRACSGEEAGGCPDPLELRQGVGGRREGGAPAREWAQGSAAACRRCSKEAAPEEGGACSEEAASEEGGAARKDGWREGILVWRGGVRVPLLLYHWRAIGAIGSEMDG